MNQNSRWISSYIRLTQLGQHVSIDLAKKKPSRGMGKCAVWLHVCSTFDFFIHAPRTNPYQSQGRQSAISIWQPLHSAHCVACSEQSSLLSCSSPVTHGKWIPALTVFEEDNAVIKDYIARYDTKMSSVKYLAFERLSTSQGYSSHSLDVVPSVSNLEVPSHLHHQPPEASSRTW